MLPLIQLAFLVVTPDVPADARHPEAVEVFRCDFGEEIDLNHDGWPDHWTRRINVDYPAFVPVGLAEASKLDGANPAAQSDSADAASAPAAAAENYCVRIDLDGGAAALFSPPVPVSPLFSYVLEADVQTRSLAHDAARISVTFLDARRRPVEAPQYSSPQGGTQSWTQHRIGPFSSDGERAAFVVIGLHLEPQGEAFDLRGTAMFDNLWLARLPRMRLASNSPHNVYASAADVKITCHVSGILQRDPTLTFELLDLHGQTIAQSQEKLQGRPVPLGAADASASHLDEQGYEGSIAWRPPIDEGGFYRVRVQMRGSAGVLHERMLSLAVVPPQPAAAGGEFGWSLPQGERPLPLAALASLLGKAGVNWAKFPMWFDPEQPARAEALAHFSERLSTQEIKLVGLLDQPPPAARTALLAGGDRTAAATVFAQRDAWQPTLHPIITRLSLQVRWWQLGSDDDISFMNCPDLVERIAEVKRQMGSFGQELHLGFGWRWLNELPHAARGDGQQKSAAAPWDFLNLTSDPGLTADELDSYLAHTEAASNARRWVTIQPLSSREYSLEDRTSDLVHRMLAAKNSGADAIFASDPFAPHTGLMNPDGTPGELLLPWRTTAAMIGGTQLLGSIRLPGGSQNCVLARGSQTIMVVWNRQPTEEVVNLGDPHQIEHVELWGRSTRPQQRGHEQVYQVGPLPTFLTGIDRRIVQWMMDFEFVNHRLESAYGRPQYPVYRIRNPLQQGVGGTMTIHTPEMWGKPPLPVRLNLAAGEDRTDRFEITLRGDASTGAQPVRVDFDLVADRDYKFSVWRTMEVGLGDVSMAFTTRADEQGNLVVEQKLENHTTQYVNFKCFLFAPGRRRLRHDVLHLSQGSNLKVYVLPRAEELLGQTLWVRAEEIQGERVLNYRFEAAP